MRLESCYSGSFVGKKMNSDQATCRLVPSPSLFFLKHQNGAVLDQKLGIFADFQLSPLAFNFFNLTSSFCQLDPYSLAPFADWPLALDVVNLTPNWPQNFNCLSI